MKIRILLLFGATILMTCASATTLADWGDSFTDYADGSQIVGQGDWEEWGPDCGGLVTSAYAYSAPHSLEIVGASDVVHQFAGYDTGQWAFTAWNYVPADFEGESYFILLNTFGAVNNWSTQIRFDSALGVVESEFETAQLPLITDAWVKLQVLIDFDANMQDIYYDGGLLSSKSWTEGVSGGGALNLGALDLFANGATAIYWDALSVGVEIPEPASLGLLALAALLAVRRR